MIESLVPGVQALARQRENLPAEPAPELVLAVAADPVLRQKIHHSVAFFYSVMVG